jgi:hypothetical protein
MKDRIKNFLKRVKNLRNGGSKRFSLTQPNMQYTPGLIPVGVSRKIQGLSHVNKTFFSLLIIKVFCTNPFMFL